LGAKIAGRPELHISRVQITSEHSKLGWSKAGVVSEPRNDQRVKEEDAPKEMVALIGRVG
jgi:hypothetical protein